MKLCCVPQGMSLHWCMQPDVGLPQPDAVIFLSLDADAAVHRASYGNERYENIVFQRRVADAFKRLKSPYWEVCVFDKQTHQSQLKKTHVDHGKRDPIGFPILLNWLVFNCLQCFDTIGWASGRASGLWWLVGVVICLARGADCLCVIQLMPLHPKTPSSLASFKARLVLLSWYRLAKVVLEKRPLSGCSCFPLLFLWSYL